MTEMSEKVQLHKKRQISIEMLRLLAMMMVVSLHFLAKGRLLPALTEPMNGQGYLAWFLESFSIMAVDVYVLISGYFLVETGFRCRRVISLVLQVMFYTCLIPVLLLAAGYLKPGEITFYNILQYVFPTNMLHYWFVSAYVLMFLFTPVLNAAVHAMRKTQLQAAIGILLLMESVSKTVIPVRLELDNLGYDALWFLVVYLIAAYIRLYGISFFEGKTEKNVGKEEFSGTVSGGKRLTGEVKALFCFFLSGFAIYGLTLLIRGAFFLTGQFENFIESAYGYNHLLTVCGAVSLFYVFKNRRIRENKATSFLCRLAPCTFGVYLIHEHVHIRYEWPRWLGADSCNSPLSLLLHWLGAVVAVMIFGLAVDYLRNLLFLAAGKLLSGGKLDRWLRKADDRVNGIEA